MTPLMQNTARAIRLAIFGLATVATPASPQATTTPPAARARETPLSMVNALHTAFGEHHARAVHTKGVMLEGSFAPTRDASALTEASVFASGMLPVTARFSLFAGVPDLSDTDDGASPAGFAFKIRSPDGNDFDVEANQHPDFITATFDEFAVFLRALGAAHRGDKAPLDTFLPGQPHPGVEAADPMLVMRNAAYPISLGQRQ